MTQRLASHIGIDAAWLARRTEPVLEPGLPIVDPHHHLWHRPGWRYLLDDLLEDLGTGHDVRATVYVQARAMYRADAPAAFAPVGETEFAVGTAAMSASGRYGPARACAGIVAHADLRLGAGVEAVLDEHARVAGERFKGIRFTTAWDADPGVFNPELGTVSGMLADRAFREGFARLAPRGLVFDSFVYHPQMPELVDLARAFPDTTIVVDHVGGPVGIGPYAQRPDEVRAGWLASIRALAACPNVVVKLGGLGMWTNGVRFHEAPEPPSSEQLAAAYAPWILPAIEAFGAERCMFESNFPVDKGSSSYPVLWNAFKRLAAGASAGEKASLFHGTASRVYRLGNVAAGA